ncbi:YesL family protein [Niallia sp. 03133]|uniref:YesL family protein n=1 Tax=Niallia sp. 03133 TaxID=3458060 RepID=UPI004043F883
MEFTGFIGWIYRCCRWITSLIYLNFLWLVFTALGLILFGFFPATAALFETLRRAVREGFRFPITRTFFSFYRSSFWKVNIIGVCIIFTSSLISFYLWLFFSQESSLLQVMGFVGLFVYLLVLLYLFPVYSHYELSLLDYLRYSISIALLNWSWGVVMMIGLAIEGILFMEFPPLMLFFGGSVSALLLTSISLRVFRKMEKKKEEVNGKFFTIIN